MCLLAEEVPAEISHSDSSLSLDFGQPRLPFYLTLLGVAQWIRPVVIQPQPTQCSWASNGGIVSPWSPPAQVKLYLCIYWHEWLFPIKVTGMWMLMWLIPAFWREFLTEVTSCWQRKASIFSSKQKARSLWTFPYHTNHWAPSSSTA